MTASERSYVGFAKQAVKGTPISSSAAYDYMLFSEGGISPAVNAVPLDIEVGGGALLRDVQSMGVVTNGQFAFIPRPVTLGWLLAGALGGETVTGTEAPYTHQFHLPTDQFDAPYFTFRSAPGNMWGEQYQDCRISGLALTWRGANYLRGVLSVNGGLPAKVDHTGWSASTHVDGGPQFLAPISKIELPTSTPIKVLGGTFAMGLNIPLDEQWIVGSYTPDAYDITSRSYVLSMAIKITDGALYSKMAYDPAGVSSNWVASLLRESNFDITFNSNVMAAGTTPYSLSIAGNGGSGQSASNVVWSVAPIGLRAGRQVIMNATATFLADPTSPVSVTLVNNKASYLA